MSDLIVPNIICFQTQKQLASLNKIRVLLKSVFTDLRARNLSNPVLAGSISDFNFLEVDG